MSVQPVGTTVENFAVENVLGLGDGVGVGARDGSLLPPHAAAVIRSNARRALPASLFDLIFWIGRRRQIHSAGSRHDFRAEKSRWLGADFSANSPRIDHPARLTRSGRVRAQSGSWPLDRRRRYVTSGV